MQTHTPFSTPTVNSFAGAYAGSAAAPVAVRIPLFPNHC